MSVTYGKAIDYAAVLADLQGKLEQGQARFENWQIEKNDLLATIQGIKAILARDGGQTALSFPSGISSGGVRNQPVNFQGLNYKNAVRKCFEMKGGGPLTAPMVTDMLLAAGYGKSRTTIKNNVDGTFRVLRERGVLQKREDGRGYELASGSLL
ncbi:MAG TPA: hypothetical protein VGQ24_05130 [Gemmatimonadales bacterium]|jgi:hypothetical protein|nr:hypothetical protein [Gemmatimonadales bacterium]